ncbi:MAG: hypothetical protein AABZ06_09230 [Bdellovibrionota bacterium]
MKWVLILVIILNTQQSLPSQASEEPKRQKVIDFEDEMIEGVNKHPYDSVSQISESQKSGHKQHLYKKRIGFRTETHELLKNMRFIYGGIKR